jgi:hypothetical protein
MTDSRQAGAVVKSFLIENGAVEQEQLEISPG